MKVLRHLPNALTCANLVTGCIGIRFAIHGQLDYAAYSVWLACVFDFFDGFAARLLKVTSPIGKELDSLADVVSFGVLPAMVMFFLISNATEIAWPPYVALLIAALSALRLAKFNIDERQTVGFIGLPTPANALFITALIFLPAPLNWTVSNPTTLVVLTIVLSFLLISPIKLFALKFKDWSWAENRVKFTFIGISVLLIGWQQAAAIPLIILLYVVASLLVGQFSRP